ncbi:thiol reductant ABC exporter subunit CydC [Actinomadura barringtoniae]|uniref:Thiol reductant ABC exporter subunit CydC n=1 Tax=Actinomadura barringtoniae TaxID=1427535 RepID=A0A939T8F9_9ACTN|nr:thiol reductant ABC exporter subunit CydC [Actinomadura barringtoniae]MBO2450292.1 thiol reductant ABC exporter subunit CydC [Actinomadura barringtoniae]
MSLRWGLRLGGAAVAGAAALACGVGLMATSAWLISRASQHPPVLYLMVAIVSVRAFGLGRGVLRYAERIVGHDAALRLLERSRVRIFERLTVVSPAVRPGALGAVVDNVEGVADRWLRGVLPMVAAGTAGIVAVILEWWLLPAAGGVLAAALVVGGVAAPLVAWWGALRSERRGAAARAELSARTGELVDGLPELVAYGALPGRLEELRRVDARVVAAGSRSAWTAGLGNGLTVLAGGCAVVGALAFGVPAVRDGRLDWVLLAVIVLTPLAAFEALGAMSEAAQGLLRAREDSARVRGVLEAEAPAHEPAEAAGLPEGRRLSVRGLRARWPGAEEADGDALVAPDLELPSGWRVAVMGRSGAGKSTLAAVLVRFLDYRGSVTLGGVELRDLAADEVRSVIALCGQDAYLFDTSVLENVRLARPGAPDGDVAAALRRAGLGRWLAELPDGLETRVGEHGARVSGGERQRIALARALLADAPILILDEPDAHLDDATATAVLTDLFAAAHGRTVVLISHRAAIPGADPVLRHVDEVVTFA